MNLLDGEVGLLPGLVFIEQGGILVVLALAWSEEHAPLSNGFEVELSAALQVALYHQSLLLFGNVSEPRYELSLLPFV